MKQKIYLIILLMALSGVGGFLLSLYVHGIFMAPLRDEKLFHFPVSFVKQIENDHDAGRKIFHEFCISCHGVEPIISVNAPRVNNKKHWDNYRKLGMPFLLERTIKGAGAMPARGGCFECSDEQLKEAVQYILDLSE